MGHVTRSRILVGVAAVLAGTTALLFVFGFVYNPIILVAAVPFGIATAFIWSHATGRLDAMMRERARVRREPGRQGPGSGDSEFDTGPTAGQRRADNRRPVPGDVDAARLLGVDPDADEATIRRAYREKVKALHPDAPSGDEASFRRVQDAYERLRRDR